VSSVPTASFQALSYNNIYRHIDGGDGLRGYDGVQILRPFLPELGLYI